MLPSYSGFRVLGTSCNSWAVFQARSDTELRVEQSTKLVNHKSQNLLNSCNQALSQVCAFLSPEPGIESDMEVVC